MKKVKRLRRRVVAKPVSPVKKKSSSVPIWIGLAFCLFLVFGDNKGCSIIGEKPPFKTDKLSVLIVEESAAHGTYTPDQLNIIQSTDPKSVKVAVESKGGRFHVIDKDIAPDKLLLAPPWVPSAFEAAKGKAHPWAVGATPTRGFSAPATTEADMLNRVGGL